MFLANSLILRSKIIHHLNKVSTQASTVSFNADSIYTTLDIILSYPYFAMIVTNLILSAFSEKYLYWNSRKIKIFTKFIFQIIFIRFFHILRKIAEEGKCRKWCWQLRNEFYFYFFLFNWWMMEFINIGKHDFIQLRCGNFKTSIFSIGIYSVVKIKRNKRH